MIPVFSSFDFLSIFIHYKSTALLLIFQITFTYWHRDRLGSWFGDRIVTVGKAFPHTNRSPFALWSYWHCNVTYDPTSSSLSVVTHFPGWKPPSPLYSFFFFFLFHLALRRRRPTFTLHCVSVGLCVCLRFKLKEGTQEVEDTMAQRLFRCEVVQNAYFDLIVQFFKKTVRLLDTFVAWTMDVSRVTCLDWPVCSFWDSL